MRKELWVPCILAIIGIVLLAGGVSAHLIRAERAVVCEACGMEVEKEDISTFQIVTGDGKAHYGCCPICALAIAAYHRDASIHGFCFRCGEEITIQVGNGELLSAAPSGAGYNVSVVFGKACVKNKIVCSEECAEEILRTEPWAEGLPVIPIQKAFTTAKAKVPEFKMEQKAVEISAVTYSLMGIGSLLIISAPVSWKLFKKREKQ